MMKLCQSPDKSFSQFLSLLFDIRTGRLQYIRHLVTRTLNQIQALPHLIMAAIRNS